MELGPFHLAFIFLCAAGGGFTASRIALGQGNISSAKRWKHFYEGSICFAAALFLYGLVLSPAARLLAEYRIADKTLHESRILPMPPCYLITEEYAAKLKSADVQHARAVFKKVKDEEKGSSLWLTLAQN